MAIIGQFFSSNNNNWMPAIPKNTCINNTLPNEIIYKIFEFLTPEDLSRASRTCRQWCVLASDELLWKAAVLSSSSIIRIDENDWKKICDLEKYDLSFEGKKSLDFRSSYPTLKKLASNVEGDETVKLAIIDKPKNLTINKLIQIANAPKQGNKTRIRLNWYRITQDLGDVSTKEASTIAITTGVLISSRSKSVKELQNMVNALGCEMPKLEDGLLVSLLTHILSEKTSSARPYNKRTYSCTVHNIDDLTLAFGGFDVDSLSVGVHFDDSRLFGVGAVSKF